MHTMDRTIKRTKSYGNNSRILTVTCKLNENGNIKEWSFQWEVYKAGKPHLEKYWLKGWQCIDSFPEEVQRVWKIYHLNGMTPWTPAQNEIIKTYKENNPDWHYNYSKACNILKKHNLYEDNGYRYGSGWLYPADVNAAEMLQFWDTLDRPEYMNEKFPEWDPNPFR